MNLIRRSIAIILLIALFIICGLYLLALELIKGVVK